MLDRSIAPPFVKSTTFQLPKVARSSLSNGIKIIHQGGIHQQLAKIEVIFDAGKWFESKPEVAHFTIQMLDKGSGKLSSSQVAAFFDFYGAHIELSSNLDYASISLYALSKHLAALLPVFVELITTPSFDEDEFIQLKEQFVQGLQVKKEKTSYLASKLIREMIYGPLHPYGNTADVSDIEKIDVTDLKSHFISRIKPTHVFILGQISQPDFETLQNCFANIACNTSPEPVVKMGRASTSAVYIEKKNSVQSSVRLGKRTVHRTHGDYAHTLILNYYLGGYFGSMLMKNLREEKGLTYGVSSSINSFKKDSLLLIGTDVNKENRKLAVDEILDEIDRLQTSVSESELELAKRHFIGSLQGEIASPFSILGKIKNIELNNLPEDYYQNLINQIDSVSVEKLTQLASQYFTRDTFLEAAVG